MSFKVLQFSPHGSTRVIRVRAVPPSWVGSYDCGREFGFLNSWMEDDSNGLGPRRVNWGAIAGLALSLTISVGFWTGIALMVERIVK